MRSLCVIALLAASVVGQDEVRVVSTMRDDAVGALHAHLQRTLPDLSFDVQRFDEAELANRFAQGMEVDVVAGVDAQLCEIAAAYERLLPVEAPKPAFYHAPGDRFLVPWAVGWVAVWIEGETTPPLAQDELIHSTWDDALIAPSPRAAPSLWAGWLRDLGRMQLSEDDAFGWFHALDGRIAHYAPTIGGVVAEFEFGRGELAFLPSDVAVELARRHGAGKIGFGPLREGVPLGGLGVALVRDSHRPDAARRTFDALFLEELAATLRGEHDLFTFGHDSYAPPLDRIAARVQPYAPVESVASLQWLRRFEQEIRGRRRDYETVGVVLDIVMTIGFFVAAWFVLRTIKKEEFDAA